MDTFLQVTIYGVLNGGLLALVAVGFSMVWGIMNIVNVSHGAFVILGAYIAWGMQSWLGLDPFLGMFVSAAVLFCVGYILQRYLINLIVNGPVFITLLLTFGIEIILIQGMNIAFTPDYRSIQTSYSATSLAIGEIRIPLVRLLAFLLAILITFLLVAFVKRTRTGISIMATGMDRGAARLMGIRARHVYAITFGISVALAGMAGTMIATIETFDPSKAGKFTMMAFVVAVIGGLGNMRGALIGGILLGLVQAWGSHYISTTLVNAIAFLSLIIVLAVRPNGLVGRSFYAARLEV